MTRGVARRARRVSSGRVKGRVVSLIAPSRVADDRAFVGSASNDTFRCVTVRYSIVQLLFCTVFSWAPAMSVQQLELELGCLVGCAQRPTGTDGYLQIDFEHT